ncbi:MAG: pyridoxamine 5'-phosphate oxidase family protein [Candidatus Binatia bacterium]|nr:pyridoxamine 5'-phosphate oxidase family protein [Candidatus Binatia bacterium]
MRGLPLGGAWQPGSRAAKLLALAFVALVTAPAVPVLGAEEGTKVINPEQEAYLRDHVWAVLGTGRKDGSPQLSMVAYEFDGVDIAISIKSYTAKWKNILRQPDVALLVHDGRKQLIIYGTVEAIAEDPERRDVIRRVMTRLRPEAAGLDDEALTKILDQQERTALRLVPKKVFLND